MLRVILLPDLFDLLISPEEDRLDSPFERGALIEQGRQARAGPPDIADGAHKFRAAAVARTFQRGGDGCAFARFELGQSPGSRLPDQAGDLQAPLVGVKLGDTVML